MSRFRDELKVIPRTARAIAALGYIFVAAMFSLFVMFSPDKEMARTPEVGKIFIMVVPGFVLAIYILIVGYVYADAKRRGMRYVMWTLLAIFIPNAIGIILYFVMRDPLLAHCTNCGAEARQGFAFCPRCGGSLALACPQCRKAVEPGWSHCVHCGAALTIPAVR